MVLWLGEYQALTIAGCINQMSRFGSSLLAHFHAGHRGGGGGDRDGGGGVIVNQGISHLSVFKSCMAAQCPLEIMFMKCSCSEVAGAVR